MAKLTHVNHPEDGDRREPKRMNARQKSDGRRFACKPPARSVRSKAERERLRHSSLPRVKDKIIGVTLGGMRVTQKEFHLIQLAYHDGFQAGRKSK